MTSTRTHLDPDTASGVLVGLRDAQQGARGVLEAGGPATRVGVRLLARTALHALEADAAYPAGVGPPPPGRTGRHAPGDTAARRADEESHRA